jgi:hypothetical protein
MEREKAMSIDYARMSRERPQQKAALTRAIKSGNRAKIISACSKAVRQWNDAGGAWPDDWSRWQRALDDSAPFGGGYRYVSLEELA